jgi:type II secretory pathway predicted ATPase ExeA
MPSSNKSSSASQLDKALSRTPSMQEHEVSQMVAELETLPESSREQSRAFWRKAGSEASKVLELQAELNNRMRRDRILREQAKRSKSASSSSS